jgi:hypothetical protein
MATTATTTVNGKTITQSPFSAIGLAEQIAADRRLAQKIQHENARVQRYLNRRGLGETAENLDALSFDIILSSLINSKGN